MIKIEHKIIEGDALEELQKLPERSVQTVVTSPPYFGLRDYGEDGQIGLESSPDEYVQRLVQVFREVWRVLRDDGTVWLNLGDSYATSSPTGHQGNTGQRSDRTFTAGGMPKKISSDLKPKDLIGVPWRVAFALQRDGWYLRQDIIWAKGSCMPESVTDRCTKAHEYIFLLTKSQKYYYDHQAIKEPLAQSSIRRLQQNRDAQDGSGRAHGGIKVMKAVGDTNARNKRSVWNVSPKPFKEAHFAVFPPELIEPCIMAGAPQGGVVLDPFLGAGTTTMVAKQLGRIGWGIELNHEYCEIARERLRTALHPKNANPRHPAPSQSKITCFCE